MGNMNDYLDWRGDIPFSVDPFNEVDNLILSELVYTPFDGIMPMPEEKRSLTMREADELFFQYHSEEECLQGVSSVKVAPLLLKRLAVSKRFQNVKLMHYVSHIDEGTQVQFACITFLLPDGTYYVAFRGTDHTIVGWKEDFNMSFLKQTPGQCMAADYLNTFFRRTRRKIRVGGHSKGGNFAIYASAFCHPSVQKKIISVYSNDGPGFREDLLKEKGFKNIQLRIQHIVPEETIVSMLFINKGKRRVICSSGEGVGQHDAMTWQVTRNHFDLADGISEKSLRFQKTFQSWIYNMEDEKRQIFVDELFGLIAMEGQDGILTLDDLVNNPYQTMLKFSKNMGMVKEEHQAVMKEALKKLAISGTETARDSFFDEARKMGTLYMKKAKKKKK